MLAGCAGGLLAFAIAWRFLPAGLPRLGDVVGTEAVLAGYDKRADLIIGVVVTLTSALVAIFALFTPLPDIRCKLPSRPWRLPPASVLIPWALFGGAGAAAAASLLRGGHVQAWSASASSAAVLLGCVMGVWASGRGSNAAWSTGLLAWAGSGLALLIVSRATTSAAIAEAAPGLAVLLSVLTVRGLRDARPVARWFFRIVVCLLPVGLPLALDLVGHRGLRVVALAPPGTRIGLLLLAVTLFVAAWRRHLEPWRQPRDAVTAMAAAGVAAVAAIGPTRPWIGDLIDNFHAGELALQWMAVHDHGALLYRDVHATPGAYGYLSGALSTLLYGGIDRLPLGLVALTVLLAAALGYLSRQLLGSYGPLVAGACVFASVPAFGPRVLVPAVLVVTLLRRPLREGRPATWLVTWLMGSLAASYLVPPSAPIAVALGVLALPRVFEVWRVARSGARSGEVRYLLAGLGAVVLALPVLAPMVAFVIESSATNLVDWGLPLRVPRGAGDAQRDVLRTAAWWAGPAVLVSLVGGVRSRGPDRSWVIAAMGICALVASVPYAWTRIDHSGGSRLALSTTLLLFFVVPAAVAAARGARAGAGLCAGTLFLVAVVTSYTGAAFSPAAAAPHRWLASATVGPSVGAASPARPSGRTAAAKARAEAVAVAVGDGTLWDAADQVLIAAYVGRPTSVPYVSSAFTASERAQRRVVAAFSEAPPRAVLVGPTATKLPFALRAPRIHRWLAESGYGPEEVEGTIILRPQGVTGAPSRLVAAARDHMAPRDLAWLPRSWGANLPALADRFAAGAAEFVAGPSGQLAVDVRRLPDTGGVPDYLAVAFDCGQAAEQWAWSTTVSPDWSVEFTAATGWSILPLGSDYAWFGESPDRRVELSGPRGSECRVTDAAAYRLR